MELIFLAAVIGAFVCGIVGYAIADQKNAGMPGFWLGLLLGPIGIVIAAVALDNRPQCPACRSRIERGASVCPACRCSLGWYADQPQRIEEKPKRQAAVDESLFLPRPAQREMSDNEAAEMLGKRLRGR